MIKEYFEMKYYNIYYFCNIIVNVIHSCYYLVKMNEFFEGYDESCIDGYKFPRHSISHHLLGWIVEKIIWEEMDGDLSKMDSKYSNLEVHKDDEL